jgi:hypothetical protein
MSQRASSFLTLFALAALCLVPCAPGAARRAADNGTLYVTFNANKTVTVTDASGNPVGTSSGAPTTIPAGTYNVLISDPAFVSDVVWDLAGPGVKLVTSMSSGEEISEAWVETFAANSTYTYRDDNRPPAVWTFVTSSSSAPASTGPTAPPTSTTPIPSSTNGQAPSTDLVGSAAAVYRGTLLGAVSAAGKATLTLRGKAVTSLKAGRYTITVKDASAKAGFNIQEIRKGATTITTAAFRGTKSRTLVLTAGQWFFYPTFVAPKTYFIVVAG